MIVLAPLSSTVTKKVKHAAWKKFLTQLNGVGANMDSAQTLRCFMDKHSQASSTLKKGKRIKEGWCRGIEGICSKEVEIY